MYTFVMCLVMVVTARAGPPIRDHPPLRKSLFPNVPPTINFLVNKENLDFQLPEEIRRTLVYFQSGHKGKGVFSKIMDQTGFHESNETQKATFFWLWGQIRDMRPLLVDEKRSRFHGIEVLTEKDTLWNSYKTKRATFGDEFLYVPKTFILPQERKQLKKEMVSVGPSGRWISKPFSASGDILDLARYQIPNRISKKNQMKVVKSLNLQLPLCFDERQFSLELFEFEKMKQNQSSLILTESILDELTPADTRVLIAAEDELDISNRFKRIFPTKETHTYLKFFDEPRYYNTLLSAWEQRFSDDREAGRDILKSLCRDNFHTLVPIK